MMAEEIEMIQQPDDEDEVSFQQPILCVTNPDDINSIEDFKQVCKFGSATDLRNMLQTKDPNSVLHKSRPIHWVAESGNVHAMTVLLEDRRTVANHCNGYKRTALHLAAKEGNYEVLKLLLENTEGKHIDINAEDKQGRTALHLAADMLVEGDGTDERYVRCLSHLMRRLDLELNKPDMYGRTALSRALRKSLKSRALVMLKHNTVHKHNLDYCLVDGITVRECIQDHFPEFVSLMPDPIIEDIHFLDSKVYLLATLQQNLLVEFVSFIENNRNILESRLQEPYHSTFLELACLIKGREKFVEAILNAGLSPNVRNHVSGIPLLHMTAERLNLPALAVLLNTKEIDINIRGLNNGTVFHWLALNKYKQETEYSPVDECFSLLLNSKLGAVKTDTQDSRGDTPLHVAVRWQNQNLALNLLACKASVSIQNKSKYTPLHVAALSGNKDVVLTLLKYGADINAHGRGTPLHVAAQSGNKDIILLLLKQGANLMYETQGDEPPLHYIEPQTLKQFFDDCIHSNGKSAKSQNYMLTFKYNFISPTEKITNVTISDTVMQPLLKMSEIPDLRFLLKHPLISTVLCLKWHYARTAVYLHIILYTLFLTILTLHVLFITNCVTSQRCINENSVTCEHFGRPLNILLWIFLLSIVGREILQFIIDRREYLNNGRNIVDLSIILSTAIVGWNCNMHITRHAASISILLAWIEFLLLIGRLPSISVQLEMLKKVCKTFIKFGACYSPLIMAFSLSFNILFEGKHNLLEDNGVTGIYGENMNKIFNSSILLFQTFIMFTGEFETKELPFLSTPITSHLVFLLFIFLVALAMLNLLNGLAVSDTKMIQDDAETLSLVARAKLVLQMETIVLKFQNMCSRGYLRRFCFFFGDLANKRLYIYPNPKFEVKCEPRGKVLTVLDSSIVYRAVNIATKKNDLRLD